LRNIQSERPSCQFAGSTAFTFVHRNMISLAFLRELHHMRG